LNTVSRGFLWKITSAAHWNTLALNFLKLWGQQQNVHPQISSQPANLEANGRVRTSFGQVDRSESCLLLYEFILAAVPLLCGGAPVEGALELWA
jgi:hypothetical protein